MSLTMAISYFLKRTEQTYKTQQALSKELKNIRGSYQVGEDITDETHCMILRDYIEDIHPDSNEILDGFLIDECQFYFGKSEDYRTKCFYITNGEGKRSFSTTKFSAPSAKANFSQRCSYIIQEIKRDKKEDIIEEKGLQGGTEAYNLHHKQPRFSEIVNIFIVENQLTNHLKETISENGKKINAPEFVDKYEYLNEAFVVFYEKIMPSLDYKIEKVIHNL